MTHSDPLSRAKYVSTFEMMPAMKWDGKAPRRGRVDVDEWQLRVAVRRLPSGYRGAWIQITHPDGRAVILGSEATLSTQSTPRSELAEATSAAVGALLGRNGTPAGVVALGAVFTEAWTMPDCSPDVAAIRVACAALGANTGAVAKFWSAYYSGGTLRGRGIPSPRLVVAAISHGWPAEDLASMTTREGGSWAPFIYDSVVREFSQADVCPHCFVAWTGQSPERLIGVPDGNLTALIHLMKGGWTAQQVLELRRKNTLFTPWPGVRVDRVWAKVPPEIGVLAARAGLSAKEALALVRKDRVDLDTLRTLAAFRT